MKLNLVITVTELEVEMTVRKCWPTVATVTAYRTDVDAGTPAARSTNLSI